jgi:hypothetical protein
MCPGSVWESNCRPMLGAAGFSCIILSSVSLGVECCCASMDVVLGSVVCGTSEFHLSSADM